MICCTAWLGNAVEGEHSPLPDNEADTVVTKLPSDDRATCRLLRVLQALSQSPLNIALRNGVVQSLWLPFSWFAFLLPVQATMPAAARH